MAKLYHVSEDGVLRECKAKPGNCYLGQHFDSIDKGNKYLESIFEESFFNNKDLKECLLIDNQKYIYNKKAKEKIPFTVNETMKRTALVELKIKEALEKKQDTKSLYFNPNTNMWTTERTRLHNKILSKLEDEYKNASNDGIVIISSGLSGAGKSTVISSVLQDRKYDFCTIDSDRIKEELIKENMCPKIEGLTEMESVGLIHSESSYLADVLLTRMAKQKKNIIYDCTCKDLKSTMKRINLIKENGYSEDKIKIIHVDVSVDTSKERAKARYRHGLNEKVQNNNGYGGRWVPLSVIDGCQPKNKNFKSSNAETIVSLYENGLIKHKPQIFDNSGSKPEEIKYNDFIEGKI